MDGKLQKKGITMAEKTGQKRNTGKCRYAEQCGGCTYQGVHYKEQLQKKQKYIEELLKDFGHVEPILGMAHPECYRNKVHHGFTKDRSGNIISGPYEAGSHWIIDVKHCGIEDKKCQEVAETVRRLCRKLKVPVYNEKTGNGVMRRVLVRRGFATGEVMVVLVVGSPKFSAKRKFAAELAARHPEIVTIISNLNDKHTSMILGDREEVLLGDGYIHDILCGKTFRISSKSFYQVNPVQTEVLYRTALDFAGLTGKETVIDAYCGIGTIGICAADAARSVISVELNPDAVRDAKANAAANHINNMRFFTADAGEYMKQLAAQGQRADVVFMDPPRSGSTIRFMRAAMRLGPRNIVYISCGPESLAGNLKFFRENGYEVCKIQPVDMFPFTRHVETVCLLSKLSEAKHSIDVKLDMDELDVTTADK